MVFLSRRTLLGATSAAAFLATLPLARTVSAEVVAAAVHATAPKDPKRVVCIDYATLDMMRLWGVENRIVGAAALSSVPFLAPLPEGLPVTGGLKDANLEAIADLKPDLIVITGRLARREKEIGSVAPVLLVTPDQRNGALASYGTNLLTVASLFGKTDAANALIDEAKARVAAIRGRAAGKSAAVLMVNEGRIGMLAPQGRCSMISAEMGFANVVPPRKGPAPKKDGSKSDAEALANANRKTLEDLKRLHPEYVFVLNKDIAVGRKPATDYRAIFGADWDQLPAVKAGRAFELSHAAWYLGEGGPTAMNLMLADVEKAVGIK